MDIKQKRRFYLCHRLDSPTSGIIIGASTKEIAAIIKGKFAKREVQKTYLAITQLNPRVKEGLWSDRLREQKIDGKLRVVRGSGLPCQCKVRFIRNKKGSMNLNLIEITFLEYNRFNNILVLGSNNGHILVIKK